MNNKSDIKEKKVLEKTLDSLSNRTKAPKSGFVILLLLYYSVTMVVSIVSRSESIIMIAGNPFPISSLAGVLSSLANICVILLAVFYRKAGFAAALTVLLVQLPIVTAVMFIRGNVSSLPGIFANLLTIVAIVVIRINSVKVERYQARIRNQAVTDLLTGLPNRFASYELVHELVKQETPHAVVTIDINDFKTINETMGFEAGNKVIKEVASRWKNIADHGLSGTLDFIVRLNGDEFALIIRDFQSEEDILKTIRMYEDALEEKVTIDEYEFFLNASFGYSRFPEDTREVDSLLSYSTAAMKEVKRAGNSDHILRFTPDLLKEERTLEIENKIREALENDAIYFQLQPQYNMSHELRGFEALARMKDKDGKLITPTEFIPVAEKMGVIDKLDGIVFRKSAMFVGGLIQKSGANIILSVNASVRHLMKKNFLDEVRELLLNSGLPAGQLEIEITESIMIDSAEKAMACINEIRKMGVKVAIDDFGTGYSSLSYLYNFSANLLKIDKSFIDRMNTNDSSKQYVASIISIGHIMGFEVISEGVEDPEQLEILQTIGCDYIQGFVWGRPLPKEEAEKIVMEAAS